MVPQITRDVKTDLEIDIGFGKMIGTFHTPVRAPEQPILGIHFMRKNQLAFGALLSGLHCSYTQMRVYVAPMFV